MSLRLKSYKFNPNIQPALSDPIIRINNTTIATLGNLITISGRSGVRKSTFLHGFIGSYLQNKSLFNLQVLAPNDKRNKILLLDTEQSEYSLYNQLKRLKIAAQIPEIDNSKLLIYRLRTFQAEDIKKAIIELLDIYQQEVFLLCIDNILDMVLDYNNIAETKLLMDFFKQVTESYNIVLFCVIHQSKSTAFSIGHVGSRLEALAQTSLRVQYSEMIKDVIDKNISELVVGEKIRDSDDFEVVRIHFDKSKGCYSSI